MGIGSSLRVAQPLLSFLEIRSIGLEESVFRNPRFEPSHRFRVDLAAAQEGERVDFTEAFL